MAEINKTSEENYSIPEKILVMLLEEILKDGRIDPEEKLAIKKLLPLLKISRERFQEIYQIIKKICTVNPQAGALNIEEFLLSIKSFLSGVFSSEQEEKIYRRIEKILIPVSSTNDSIKEEFVLSVEEKIVLPDQHLMEQIENLYSSSFKISDEALQKLSKIEEPSKIKILIANIKETEIYKWSSVFAAIGEKAVLPLLESFHNQDFGKKLIIISALGEIRDSRALDILFECLNSDEERMRVFAIEALGKIGDLKTAKQIKQALINFDYDFFSLRTVVAALEKLKTVPDEEFIKKMLDIAEGESISDSSDAVDLLIQICEKKTVRRLLGVFKKNRFQEKITEGMGRFLKKYGDAGSAFGAEAKNLISELLLQLDCGCYYREKASVKFFNEYRGRLVEPLIEILGAKSVDSRLPGFAWDQLAEVGSDAVEPLILALDSKNKDIKFGVISLLGGYGDIRAVEKLQKISAVLNFKDSGKIKKVAKEALNAIKKN